MSATLADLKAAKAELFTLVANDDTYTTELGDAYNAAAAAYHAARNLPENARNGEQVKLTKGLVVIRGQVFHSEDGLRIELHFQAPLVSEILAQGFAFENLIMDDEPGELKVHR